MTLNDLLAKLAKLPLPQRLLLLLALCGLVVVLDYFLFYGDIAQARTNALNKKHQDEQELAAQEANAANVQRYKNEIKELEDQAARQESVLPSKSAIPALIEQVNAQAQLAGLQITSFKPEAEVPQGSWVEIPVAMEVRGTFQQIGRFFNDLGQLPRIVNVQNLSLDTPTENEGRTVLHGSFTVATYRLPDHPTTAPGAAAGRPGGGK